MSRSIRETKIEPSFSILKFEPNVLATLGLACLALKSFAPAVWQAQWQAAIWSILAVFAVALVANSFFEFFIHRYVLHMPLIGFMREHYRLHDLVHHALTLVRAVFDRSNPSAPGIVENRFSIESNEQRASSTFPWYALPMILMPYSGLCAIVQWLLPNAPVFLGGWLAAGFSFSAYEIFHQCLHKPYQTWWKPKLESARWGWLARRLYYPHLLHHAFPEVNLSVAGFWFADLVLRTYQMPGSALEDGSFIAPEKWQAKKPCRFIGWLDRAALEIARRQGGFPKAA